MSELTNKEKAFYVRQAGGIAYNLMMPDSPGTACVVYGACYQVADELESIPDMRPMTLDEVKKHTDVLPCRSLWAEYRRESVLNGWTMLPRFRSRKVINTDYGQRYRCWPEKPTKEQMDAWPWEEGP